MQVHRGCSPQSDTDGAFGFRDRAEGPAGKEESHSNLKKTFTQMNRRQNNVAGTFHEFGNIFSSRFWSLVFVTMRGDIC